MESSEYQTDTLTKSAWFLANFFLRYVHGECLKFTRAEIKVSETWFALRCLKKWLMPFKTKKLCTFRYFGQKTSNTKRDRVKLSMLTLFSSVRMAGVGRFIGHKILTGTYMYLCLHAIRNIYSVQNWTFFDKYPKSGLAILLFKRLLALTIKMERLCMKFV